MKLRITALVLAQALSLAGCGGTIISNIDATDTKALANTAMVMPYYLPMAEVSLSASFTKGTLTGEVGKPTLSPDFSAGRLYLGYEHQGLSTENVTLAVDQNGLLKTVSSTSKGQTLELINAANEVIKQYAAYREAVAPGPPFVAGVDLKQACDGLALQVPLPLKTGTLPKSASMDNGSTRCTLTVKASTKVFEQELPNTVAFASSAARSLADLCKGLVCFRPQMGFEVTVSTYLVAEQGTQKSTLSIPARTFKFLAPNPSYLGYIKFSRGVFAERTIGAEFTNGVLTSFNSKRSSELVGFLAIPAAALTTATLLEKLN